MQLGLFSQGRPAPKDSAASSSALFEPQDTNVAIIMIGGNDFLAVIETAFNESLVPLDQDQLNEATQAAKAALLEVPDRINKCILDQVKALLSVVDSKKTAVYVMDVPALEDAPASLNNKRNYTDEAVSALADAIESHSNGLKDALESEEYQAFVQEGGSLQFVDVNQMIKDIKVTLRESNAVSNVEDACRPCALTADCSVCESPSSHFYYDLVHPTDTVHKRVGDKVVELLEANPTGGMWMKSAPAQDNDGNTINFDTTFKLAETLPDIKDLIYSNRSFTFYMPSSQALSSLAAGVFPAGLPEGTDVGKFFTDNPEVASKIMSSYIVMKEGNYDNAPELPVGGPYSTWNPSIRLTLTDNGVRLEDAVQNRKLLASSDATIITGGTKTFAATGQTYVFMEGAPVTSRQATALTEAATAYTSDESSGKAAAATTMLLSWGLMASTAAGLLL
ncbi:hypothetical protein DUNSADRAFT_16539 [Dunaliella salina]|uniref:Uncharacterized protein n=1 Tax=Dunaliella salina TaxID=3046 RepID=A0ABQ7G3C0_DUNSA|nr:hypothetical protein DUNSADRAFT_16539 [Dunaliella salina]|eukprot:KAF5829102.1 hypothetical protein DUNSADRAFT_16539 [Dunaliella salina]